MAELKQKRTLEEVKALSREEAVEVIRHAGVIGAGGGGFPTYFKYKDPQPHLIVNATESEPGYQADKLMHKEYLDEFLQLYEALKAIFGFEQVSMCVHEKDREWFSDYQEHADDLYDMRYVPDTYAAGEEKMLIRYATDTEVPWRVDTPDGKRRPGMPLDVGIIVNNSETLLNVYRALFLGRPVTTKFLQVYGEETDIKVYEVPLGASVAEVLRFAGIDVENSGHLTCLDGGPYLHDMGIEELGETGDAYVRGTTNALMLIQKGTTAYKEYTDIKTDPPEEGIVSLVGLLPKGVNLPLGRPLLEACHPARLGGRRGGVRAEDRRARRRGLQYRRLGERGRHGHLVEDNIIAIAGGAVPMEEAEAEAETEAHRHQ
jgi:Na+-translocating ferredoxin:NAD+ oxidoreductase RnfC subunit